MKYWAYVNNEILGPFDKEKLLEIPSFSPLLLVCPQTPVGEKTEDWKEASAYPEISALLGSGAALSSAPSPETVSPSPAPAPSPTFIPEPARTSGLKPLTASPIEQTPPSARNDSGINITINQLGKSGVSPAQQQSSPAARAAAFDPISLSNIERRGNYIASRETAGNPTLELAPAQQPPIAEAPSYAAPAPAIDGTALEALTRKLDDVAKNSVSRQEFSSAFDQFHAKLEQNGEISSPAKNSMFQREMTEKLSSLENAVSELKAAMRSAPAQAAPAPAAEKKSAGVYDQGSKRSGIGSALKKLVSLVLTVALLAALLLVAVIGLKRAGIFDATRYIPFPVPFLTAGGQAPGQTAALPQETPALPQHTAALPEENKAPDLTPEIIYFVRTYRVKSDGPTLEENIFAAAAKSGGNDSRANWQVKQTGDGIYEAAALIPSNGGNTAYTYTVDYNRKTIEPVDETGKAAFAAFTGAPAAARKRTITSPAATFTRESSAAKPSARPAAKRAAKKALKPAAAAKPKSDDEYEYVYEDDDGTGK